MSNVSIASMNSANSGEIAGLVDSQMRSSSSDKKKPSSLSSLTMRFMPLIECYLTVCSSTLLVHPPSIETTTDETKKRDREDESEASKISKEKKTSSIEGLSPVAFVRSTSSIGSILSTAVRPESLPGYRFRYTLKNIFIEHAL